MLPIYCDACGIRHEQGIHISITWDLLQKLFALEAHIGHTYQSYRKTEFLTP